jgi:hypothetical protein
MDELEKLLAAQNKLIDDRLEAIIDSSNDVSTNIPDVVFSIAADLVKNGKLQWNTITVLQLSDIKEILKQAYKGTSFVADVKGFTRDYNEIVGYTKDIQSSLNSIDIKTAPLYNYAKESSTFVQERLLLNISESEEFGEKLKTVLLNASVQNLTLKELKTSVTEFLKTADNSSKLAKYTTQVTRDALNQFEGQLNSNIAITYDLFGYRYVGSLVADSRPQCRRWVGMGVLPIKELDKEIAWAYANGQGMIPGTTSSNFSVFRGGFSCRHNAIPTNLKS